MKYRAQEIQEAEHHKNTCKRVTDRLESDMAVFFAKGGEIQTIPTGQSSRNIGKPVYNGTIVRKET